MSTSTHAYVTALALAGLGCSGQAPQTQALEVKSVAAAPAPTVAQTAEPAPAWPEELTVLFRVADLRTSWTGVQRVFATTSVGAMLGRISPETGVEALIGPTLANAVELTGPVDLAGFGDGSQLVMTLPLAKAKTARLATQFELREKAGAVHLIRRRDQPVEHATLSVCAIDASEDRARSRLACASSEAALEKLHPYLFWVAANTTLSTDVRVEMGSAILRKNVHELDDTAAARAGAELVRGFAMDLQGLVSELRLGDPVIDISLAFRFETRASPLARVLAPTPRRGVRVPASFMRLPADATFALGSPGVSREDLAGLRGALRDGVKQDMQGDGYDAVLLDEWIERASALCLSGGPIVLGTGLDRLGAESALRRYRDGKDSPLAREQARRAVQAWTVIGLDEPATPVVDALRDIVRLGDDLDRKKSSASSGAAQGPAKATPPRKKKTDKQNTAVVVAPPSPKLPSGAFHLELRAHPVAKDGPPAHTTHVHVVATQETTWIGIGELEPIVLNRLAVALDASHPERTLAGRPGMDALAASDALAVGVFTLAGAVMPWLDADNADGLRGSASLVDALAALPGQGNELVAWSLTSEGGDAGKATTKANARLSVPAVRDFVLFLKP